MVCWSDFRVAALQTSTKRAPLSTIIRPSCNGERTHLTTQIVNQQFGGLKAVELIGNLTVKEPKREGESNRAIDRGSHNIWQAFTFLLSNPIKKTFFYTLSLFGLFWLLFKMFGKEMVFFSLSEGFLSIAEVSFTSAPPEKKPTAVRRSSRISPPTIYIRSLSLGVSMNQ